MNYTKDATQSTVVVDINSTERIFMVKAKAKAKSMVKEMAKAKAEVQAMVKDIPVNGITNPEKTDDVMYMCRLCKS